MTNETEAGLEFLEWFYQESHRNWDELTLIFAREKSGLEEGGREIRGKKIEILKKNYQIFESLEQKYYK